MKAVSSHEVEALEDQVHRLRQQLDDERNRHVVRKMGIKTEEGAGMGVGCWVVERIQYPSSKASVF